MDAPGEQGLFIKPLLPTPAVLYRVPIALVPADTAVDAGRATFIWPRIGYISECCTDSDAH